MTNNKLKTLISEVIKEILLEEEGEENDIGRPRDPDADKVMARAVKRLGGSKKVAKRLGLSRGQIDKIIRGDSSTSAEHAVELEKITSGIIEPERIVKNAE